MDRLKAAQDILNLNNKKKSFMRRLRRRHHVFFALLVFIGAVFLWYGIWTIISDIPIINNPYIATMLGLLILFATGMYYENTL